MMTRRLKKFFTSPQWVLTLPYAWLVLFFLVPFFIVLKISFSDLEIALPPYGDMFTWASSGILTITIHFKNYLWILSDTLYIWTYVDSLLIAFYGTLGCLLVGYPIAYGIARSSRPLRTFLLVLVILPFWTSFLLRVYSWIGILSPRGILNTWLMDLNLITNPLPLLDNTWAAVLGIVYNYLPFMIFPLYISLEKINPSLIEASYDLGAKPMRTFRRITLPLSWPGIVAGSMLVMVPATGEFVIPELLGGSETLMIGKVLWTEFFNNRDWPVASSLTILTLFFLIIPILIFQRFEEKEVTHED